MGGAFLVYVWLDGVYLTDNLVGVTVLKNFCSQAENGECDTEGSFQDTAVRQLNRS